jgi:hypothetical protein
MSDIFSNNNSVGNNDAEISINKKVIIRAKTNKVITKERNKLKSLSRFQNTIKETESVATHNGKQYILFEEFNL